MSAFINLEDSPLFHKQVFTLEQTNEELKERCLGLYKGCAKFLNSLGESCKGDAAFADSLEAFGGGLDDPVSVSIGGPVISKFMSALHELASYKELLHSQVEHVLVDRLMQFLKVDMQEAKDSRQRFHKAEQAYEQAREKFLSLKKSTPEDIITEHEEELQNSKSAFERSRFGLVNALMNIESKKKYEFLESISAIMDVHLRYFKLGYELLSQLEPFIHQVLTYAQQSKEVGNAEQDKLAKRIQEFRTQAELDSLQASSNIEPTISSVSLHPACGKSSKDIEAIMQSSANGEVLTIKQGYLLKQSSSTRGEWKRRYFVLDGHGTLYYYQNKSNKALASQSNHYSRVAEQNSSVFRRLLLKHNRASSLGEDALGSRIIDLRTSTIKFDADDREMRLCFRIISPSNSYTLQAENEADQVDWVNNIKSVIATLFSSQFLRLSHAGVNNARKNNLAEGASLDITSADNYEDSYHADDVSGADYVANTLRTIPGNNFCAECSSPEPDWASLNLGILLCIECSGLHRNLGVHISKVRSVTLDVRVWEPTILDLFKVLGNTYCNSIWEALLQGTKRLEESEGMIKPCPSDAVLQKEKYIQMKYVGKVFIDKFTEESGVPALSCIWQAITGNDLREVYRRLAMTDKSILDADSDDIISNCGLIHGNDEVLLEVCRSDPSNCPVTKDPKEPTKCLRGCSLLHLACHEGNPVMLELLLQFGADINKQDTHRRTPLHHCVAMGNNSLAKFLLRRGARRSIRDAGGFSALERAMEMGSIRDEELFILLAEST
ncbi:hypothetical protein MLD38_003817 [Melastoma candidum]|uniref:Uncharacterized protein n=1 Tax=Melastoma candidum TaxID=119954 RepID=A0ACB9S416_9MYRT|nr:hypothetical protein MLD38_003817 [Melastoma candidum]